MTLELSNNFRVASSVGFLEQSVEEPADSETQGGEGDEVKRIEVYPCSSVEDQGDDDGEVDETRYCRYRVVHQVLHYLLMTPQQCAG